MINKIISFSIKNKLIIGIMMIAWIGLGVYSMKEVPIDAVPDITNNQVQVITVSPNLGTEDIEQFVTYPVELAMANLPEVTEIRSISRFGLSVVTVVFNDDFGTYLPRQLVGEKLNEIKSQIPQQFGEPFMGPISTGLGEIYQYTLEVEPEYTSKYSLSELREIQDWIVKRQMAMLEGVVEVNSIGGNNKQYEIAINPNELKNMGVSMHEIFHALETNNSNTGGAYIVKDRMANFIRGEGLARSIEDLEKIVVKTENNTPILIKDIATVRYGKAIRYGALTKDGKGEAVGGMVMLLKDGNSNDVIERVKSRVAEIQKSLPEGVSIVPFLDRAKLIAKTTGTVRNNLLEGGLIVIFVLVIFLGNFRGGLIVASTIPLSLLFAFIMMNVFGVWSNLMSLGAIDFGIIVDGAVIIVESVVFMIYKRVKNGENLKMTNADLDDISYKSSSKMMNAAFFGQLIILIVFLPILALTGVEGKMFTPMALTFSFAVIGAMILCLTYVPMASAIFMSKNINVKEGFGDKFIKKLSNWYEPLLVWVLGKRILILSISVFFLVSSGFIFSRMGGEFIPQLDEGDIAFHALLKPGSSLEEMTATSTKIERLILKNYPQVEHVVSRIGVAEIPTDPMPMDIADIFVILKPEGEWKSDQSKEEMIVSMKKDVSVLVGVNYEFTQPIEMRFNELLTGVREDVAIKIYGDNLDTLAKKATEIEKLIANIEGVGDMRAEATKGLPQMTIHYDRDRVAQYGLNIDELNKTISTAFSGESAGFVFENEKRFDIVVRLKEDYRRSIKDIKNLFVTLPNGSQIPLNQVASIDYKAGPMQISREGTNRRIYVGINVRGRDVESLIKEIQTILDEKLNLPSGYYLRYGGAFENLQKAKERLTIVVPVALALIFVLLFFALKSFSQSVMIYMSIPLSAIGGVYALWLRDMPFSISAGIGFIVLFGVAVLNGLVLVSSFNDLKLEGVTSLRERIIRGTKERIRPIFLTASTDILGFLPMALSTSSGAEVQRPLATVVIGGLLTSSFLTLIVLPILYNLLEERKKERISSGKGVKLTAIVVLVSCAFIAQPTKVFSQSDSISTVEQAIEIAMANNKQLQAKASEVSKQEALKKTSFDLGKTDFDIQYGQFNSYENDFAFSINQNFKFPTYYSNQSKWAEEKIKSSALQQDITANELKRKIKETWYQIQYLQSKKALLVYQDSVYQKFQKATQIRYETEASTLLEKTTAEAKVMQLKVQLEEVESDIQIQFQKLSLYLNLEIKSIPTSNQKLSFQLDSTSLADNPSLKFMHQQVSLLKSEEKLNKSKVLPEFKIGYFNQSMIGVQSINGVDQNIDGSTRFSGITAGISIPIWAKPDIAKVNATKLDVQTKEMQSEYFNEMLQSQVAQSLQEYNKLSKSLAYFESVGLHQANLLTEHSQKSFDNGAINYVEYVQNIEQAINIKTQYLERLNQFNQNIIYIEFLNGN